MSTASPALAVAFMSRHFSVFFSALPAILIAALLAVPVVTIGIYALLPSNEVWAHLKATVLNDYLINSAILVFFISIITLIIGVGSAWLTTQYRFFGHKIAPLLLLMPMAMPSYIIAITYAGMLDVAGPLQYALREYTGLRYGQYWFFEMRSMAGAIAMLSLVLYPYIFLMARASFLEQSLCVLDVGRTLGLSPWARFWRIALPLSRPAIIAGLALVIMETLADYGTVEYLGVQTFTTGIFRTWKGLNDLPAAAHLAAMLLFFVFISLMLEKYSRRKIHYQHTSQRHQLIRKRSVGLFANILMTIFCFLPFVLGFLAPAIQLILWATKSWRLVDGAFLLLAWHSILLALATAVLAVILALIMATRQRRAPNIVSYISLRIASMGYAIPGAVIALGVVIPASMFDTWLSDLSEHLSGERIGQVLNGTVFTLIFAYIVRFMAISLNAIEAGLGKIKPSIDDAARTWQYSPAQISRKIHFPMLKSTLFTAALIVFVDTLKELPATFILRPFDFNTLAVRAFELATDEQLFHSALPSIAIVVTGLIPIILLNRGIAHREN